MFEEIGALAGALIIALYVSVFMDAFVIFSIMIRKVADAHEYAAAVLKWPKIIILYISGAVMLFFALTSGVSFHTAVTELVLCALLTADGAVSTVIKKKYGKKK